MAGPHAACQFAAVSLSMDVGCGGAEKRSRPVPPFAHTHSHTLIASLCPCTKVKLTGSLSNCSLHYCFWQEMLLLTNKDSIRLGDEHFGLGQRTVLVFSLSSDSLFSLSLPFQVYLFFFSLSLQHSIHLLVGLSSLSQCLFFSLSMCCVPAHRPFPHVLFSQQQKPNYSEPVDVAVCMISVVWCNVDIPTDWAGQGH